MRNTSLSQKEFDFLCKEIQKREGVVLTEREMNTLCRSHEPQEVIGKLVEFISETLLYANGLENELKVKNYELRMMNNQLA